MTDLLGIEVKAGDQVVIARTGYNCMTKAIVLKLTPKGIKAEYLTYNGTKRETFRARDQFVKVPA